MTVRAQIKLVSVFGGSLHTYNTYVEHRRPKIITHLLYNVINKYN